MSADCPSSFLPPFSFLSHPSNTRRVGLSGQRELVGKSFSGCELSALAWPYPCDDPLHGFSAKCFEAVQKVAAPSCRCRRLHVHSFASHPSGAPTPSSPLTSATLFPSVSRRRGWCHLPPPCASSLSPKVLPSLPPPKCPVLSHG